MEIDEMVINKRMEQLAIQKAKYLTSGDTVAYTQMWVRLNELAAIQKEIQEKRRKQNPKP